ncbi:BNR-4 repeat-containing protein [Aeoliella sp. ICT_H6.2]|uniref:BNR-4 repeat-containing protein n=1 Tax=Aeoliella straminimaris TaxID=2954799 RepID=A0A9X2FE70_9BACT|nr:BNR-4 repeat-containing protein [Aeoliella straminimaris]MCO6046538.1 BNR-4 repeat-containing protein [Aeoliella straminimaris]
MSIMIRSDNSPFDSINRDFIGHSNLLRLRPGWLIWAWTATLLWASPALAVDDVAGDLFTLTNTGSAPNGAWSWFEDERAIVDNSNPDNPLLLVSSVSAGAFPENGDIDLLWRNLTTGAQGEYELHNQLQQDDHDSAGLYLRPDGRYLAMYAEHGSDAFTRWRISTNPHDPTSWGPEQTLNNGAGTTYNNIYYLPADNGGAGRTYNFTRTANYDPNVQVSDDDGTTWANAGKLLTEGGGGDRPYVRYASDGKKIHFIATDRHPRNFQNSVYHGYIQDGVLYNTDGTTIDDNLFDSNGVQPSALTPVFENSSQLGGLTMNRAWTINLEIDNTGNPVGVLTARVNDSNQDHRFLYARYDGQHWHVNEMAQAGAYLYAAEDDYTGLASIDPNNPNVVYMSSDIDPRDDSATSKYELYKGVTTDFGASWTWSPITENSTIDNIRPVVPEWNGQNTAITWLRGNYNSYTNWDTEVVGLTFAASDPKSLLWQGGGTSPNTWDVGVSSNWDSGGTSDLYHDGDEVAFDDSASTYAVHLAGPVAPMGVAFNNTVEEYTLTGAGIAGPGNLRVLGGGRVVLANGANPYTGTTSVIRGTLALSGDAQLAGTSQIAIAADGVLDVSDASNGQYAANGQTIRLEGQLLGNLTASNSNIQGSGQVVGDLTASSGSTIQVGSEGIVVEQQFRYVDASTGVMGNTTLSDGTTFNPPGNPNWLRRTGYANGGDIFQGDSGDPNTAPELRTTLSGLEPGRSYTVYVNYWDPTGSTWRILAGAESGDLTLFGSPLDNVAGATDGIAPATLNYESPPLTAEGNRLMWGAPLGELVADAEGQIHVFVDDTGTNDGDDRTWYDGLSISSGSEYTGQATMTIDGNYTQTSNAILSLDVAGAEVHDRLLVTGNASLAGTLQVELSAGAPAPQSGDVYDLLAFNSVEGAFDAFELPPLSAGLRWDVSNLSVDGSLAVRQRLEGDFNGDGFVDLTDFTVWRNRLGATEDLVTLSGNGTGDNIVDVADYLLWKTNFGAMSPGASASHKVTPVPEPATLQLLGMTLLALLKRY